MAEEWPIEPASADQPRAPAKGAGDRLSTVRVDFFLDPAERLTEQERALMTAMLHCLVGDIADEIRSALPSGATAANDDGNIGLVETLSAACLLDRPALVRLLLRRADGTLAVISEIKRRSPSAGAINVDVSALDQAKRYQAAGADALSILTDEKYFGGTLADLRAVTAHLSTIPAGPPCLRKDFMVHPVQVLVSLIVLRCSTRGKQSELSSGPRREVATIPTHA